MDNKHETNYQKRGYLNEDFLLFHLRDCVGNQYEFHYHDFYKIIVFISGKVTYLIEGKAYNLKPWDILLISNKDVHKALISTSEPYERIVIWFNPRFLEKNSIGGGDLLTCFDSLLYDKKNLLHMSSDDLRSIKSILMELEMNLKSDLFGKDTAKHSLFLLLVVYINRAFLNNNPSQSHSIQYDETISKVISYINSNLDGDLSIEALSAKFYMSRYTLMHKFKQQAGYSVHSFILQKRLLTAGTHIRNGHQLSDASFECGFSDYTSFVRAFKKFYGVSPRQYAKVKI